MFGDNGKCFRWAEPNPNPSGTANLKPTWTLKGSDKRQRRLVDTGGITKAGC